MTSLSAIVVTAVGALLLERSRGFFTGGFLSVDRLEGPAHIAAFVAASWLVDAAVAGLLAAVTLMVLSWARLRTSACIAGAALAASCPLLAAEAVSYEVLRYLGDAFDFGLMLDLTGGSVSEILAVAASHLVAPVTLLLLTAAAAAAVVWALHRFTNAPRAVPPSLRDAGPPLAMLLAGFVVLVVAVRSDAALENGLARKSAGAAMRWLADEATDIDRDGFGIVSIMSDPAPTNPRIFPYAPEVAGNGVDENGVGGDLPRDAALMLEPHLSSAPWLRQPDVVLIVLESFRADMVGARAGGRSVTPAIDAVAARGVAADQAYSHNGYTVQSRYHLMTGALAPNANAGSLVDDFKRNGYVTGYFSGQDESFGGPGYASGFERADVAYDARDDRARRYSTSTTPGSLAVPAAVVQERIDAFLDTRRASAPPLFLYVNFHDTHFPYDYRGMAPLTTTTPLARELIAPERRDALRATYTNAAANVDAAIGRLLESVGRARGRAPAVIITGDHGESLFDEGFLGHGYGLNDAQTRIPLVVADLPMRIEQPFGQIDLRGALSQALSVAPDAAATPVLGRGNRPVFQYLGTLARPRQIGFLEQGARVIYDFRAGMIRTHDGRWLRDGAVGDPDRSTVATLIHQWELLNLRRPEPATDAE